MKASELLKAGGHLVSFGGTRTYHRMACAIEDAGFEIRDMLAWMYGSGFPKSLDISKAIDKAAGAERELRTNEKWAEKYPNGPGGNLSGDGRSAHYSQVKRIIDGPILTSDPVTDAAIEWDGWGTGMKPAQEPIVLARKPLSEPTVAANVLKWGTGGINVDGCRVDSGGTHGSARSAGMGAGYEAHNKPDRKYGKNLGGIVSEPHSDGRWPANVVLDEEAGRQLDEQSGKLNVPGDYIQRTTATGAAYGSGEGLNASGWIAGQVTPHYGDSGGASRFFYCEKASSGERNAWGMTSNNHPTVKPVNLMRWLVRLITPPGGVVLDPFMGSGTTAVACVVEGFDWVGIEKEPEYAEIARQRVAAGWSEDGIHAKNATPDQGNLFDKEGPDD